MDMRIEINDEVGQDILSAEEIERLVACVLEGEGCPEPCEVSVSFVDADEIHHLNLEYRGIDKPTDVLSFECDGVEDELSDIVPEGFDDVYELGDVVIAPDVAERQTHEFGTTFEQEISLLFVHGLLHLCGYDHIVEEEAQVMEALEDEILKAWNSR